MFYGVFTEDGLDQVCDTMAQAEQERRDLKAMGCEVWIAQAEDEQNLAAIGDYIREGKSAAWIKRRVVTSGASVGFPG